MVSKDGMAPYDHQLVKAADVVCYKKDSKVYAVDEFGKVIAKGTNDATVVQAAIDSLPGSPAKGVIVLVGDFSWGGSEPDWEDCTVISNGEIIAGGYVRTDVITERTADNGVDIEGVGIKDGIIGADRVVAGSINTDDMVTGSISADEVVTDLVSEHTLNSGVVVDGVLLKDGSVSTNTEIAKAVLAGTSLTATGTDDDIGISLVPKGDAIVSGPLNAYDVLVFIKGTKIFAVDRESNIIASGTAGTDDSTVIQAAIDNVPTNGTVLIGPGTFYLAANLYLKSYMTFRGSGMHNTKFSSNTTSTRVIRAQNCSYVTVEDYSTIQYVRPIYVIATTTSVSNFVIRNIYCYHNASEYCFTLYTSNVSYTIKNVLIENCIAEDSSWGFLIDGPRGSWVENVLFRNCKAINCSRYYPYRSNVYSVGYSLEGPNTRNVTFINCLAQGCLESGFHHEGDPVRENVIYIGCVSYDNGQKTKESSTIVYQNSLTQTTPFVCTTCGATHSEAHKIRVRLISPSDSITAFSVRIQGVNPSDSPVDETITETTPGVTNEPNGWSFYTTSTFKSYTTPTITVQSVTGAQSGDYINVGQDGTYACGYFVSGAFVIGCIAEKEQHGFYLGLHGYQFGCTIKQCTSSYLWDGFNILGYKSCIRTITDSTSSLSIDRVTAPVKIIGTTSTNGPTFSDELLDGDNWTSDGWTGSWSTGWTHTTGNTNILSHDHAATSGTPYLIEYTVTGRTAGSFTISFGGLTFSGISISSTLGMFANGTGSLQITPTSDFNGTIVISIKAIAAVSTPIITIVDSNDIERLSIRTNSQNNLFIGPDVGRYTSIGQYNTGVGINCLRNSLTGTHNSVFGVSALSANVTGGFNSAFGADTLLYNISGSNNSAFGADALYTNTTGGSNSAFGVKALYANTTGGSNSAFGVTALYANTTGGNNSAFGLKALHANTTGTNNSAFGLNALQNNTTSNSNSAFGVSALASNTSGTNNCALGLCSLFLNTSGSNNSSFGTEALESNTSGSGNSAFGNYALFSNTTGNFNSGFGYHAGHGSNQKVDAINSMCLGANTFTTRNNQVIIGDHNVIETQLRANVYIGSTSSTAHTQPTAKLHIAAGSASASTAPLKFTSGTLMTTPEVGAVEFDGNDYYITI